MPTAERKKIGRPPILDGASTMTVRLEKKLQQAFSEVVTGQGQTSSQKIREFMLRTVREAGREDLLKSKFH